MLVSKKVKYVGLCSTCRHAATCTYLKDAKCPVINCEEFEIEISELPRETFSGKDVSASKRLSTGRRSSRDDSARYKGLCSDCENRKTCMYPKPEGGVWHCEEYQ